MLDAHFHFEVGEREALYALVITGLVNTQSVWGGGTAWAEGVSKGKRLCFTLFRPFTEAEGFFFMRQQRNKDNKFLMKYCLFIGTLFFFF